MSTAGKVLVVFVMLFAVAWMLLAGGVAQLNRNGNQALQKLSDDLEKAQEDLKTAKHDVIVLADPDGPGPGKYRSRHRRPQIEADGSGEGQVADHGHPRVIAIRTGHRRGHDQEGPGDAREPERGAPGGRESDRGTCGRKSRSSSRTTGSSWIGSSRSASSSRRLITRTSRCSASARDSDRITGRRQRGDQAGVRVGGSSGTSVSRMSRLCRKATIRRPSGWIGIVANRSSGMGRGRQTRRRARGPVATSETAARVAWTPAERSALVNRRGSGDGMCRCLVAVGGDGTVSALLNERPPLPVTVLPAGTENLVARHFGLRRDPRSLAGTIAAGRSVPVDVGQAAGRRFLLMAGFGFDAEIVSRHHQSPRLAHPAASGPRIGSPMSSRSCAPASPTGSRPSRCGSTTRAPRRCCAGRRSSSSTCPDTRWDCRSSPSPARMTGGST